MGLQGEERLSGGGSGGEELRVRMTGMSNLELCKINLSVGMWADGELGEEIALEDMSGQTTNRIIL